MKAYRYITLSPSDLLLVEQGYKSDKRHHVRKKCEVLLRSHQGYKIPELAIMFSVHCDTIREWFNQWEAEGMAGFAIKSGRGRKAKLAIADEDVVAFIKKSKGTAS